MCNARFVEKQLSLPRRQFLRRVGGYCIATPLLLESVAHAAEHKVSLTVNGFSNADKQKVTRAFWIAIERCFKEKVIKLTAKKTYRCRGLTSDGEVRYKPGKEAEEGLSYFVVYGLEQMLRIKNDKFDFSIVIDAADLDDDAVGRATIGLDTVWGYYKRKENKRPLYRIALDRKAVANRPETGTAGTIWHEMMHNAGLDHKSGGSYDQNYKGYLVKEWGLAIAADGVEGFGLVNDPYAMAGCG